MENQGELFDLVIVGSGGGGLTAALKAHEAGLRPVVVEKQDVVGGSTAMSGGIIWMPDNPLMREAGIEDSYEQGLTYLQAVVGDPDEASSPERREAFLRSGPEMISFIRGQGVEFIRCEGYSDYYDTYPGGNARGRSIEGVPWNAQKLGDWRDKINPGMAEGMGMTITTNEVRSAPMFLRSYKNMAVMTRVAFRSWFSQLRKTKILTCGASLIGQLTKILREKNIPIWLSTPMTGLIVEDGAVVGIRATHNGEPIEIRGTYGVILAAGGFEHNTEFRSKMTEKTQPADGSFSIANPGNTGEVLQAAMGLGARTEYMDEAVWFLTPRFEMAGSTLTVARQLPHTILVSDEGKRFVNESNSYIEVGRAIYATGSSSCWLIFDDAYRKMVPWVAAMPSIRSMAKVIPGRLPEEWIGKDWIVRADTLEELAIEIGVDSANLAATIEAFNKGARIGEDPLFHRGESAYNKVLGNPGHSPNAALGTIEAAPFFATRINAGDVGTIGGVITNQHGQVLGQDNAAIPGLYAAGNMAATVVGRTYPGAGASISHTMVFGYLAAQHAARSARIVST